MEAEEEIFKSKAVSWNVDGNTKTVYFGGKTKNLHHKAALAPLFILECV